MKSISISFKGHLNHVIGTLFMTVFLVAACQDTSKNDRGSNGVPSQNIHEAAFLGNIKALKQHIAAGTDLNEKDQYGSTPLTIAVTFGKQEVAKLLIDAGADLHATSADGSTPLHTAAFLCRIEIIKHLLDNGADRELTNQFGSTPLQSVQASFDQVKPVYDQLSRDLGPLGFKLDYQFLEMNRPLVAQMLTTETK